MVPPTSSAKRKRSSKETKTLAFNSQGYEELPTLPSSLKKQVNSLSSVEWRTETVSRCLKRGKCVQETEALMESSGKAVEVLTACPFANDTFQDQVAGVYEDLHTALTRCVQKGIGSHLVWVIFESSQGGDEKFMEKMHRQSPPFFVSEVLRSMQAVHHAAKAAL